MSSSQNITAHHDWPRRSFVLTNHILYAKVSLFCPLREGLALPTVSYEVTGEHSAPVAFEEYIFKTLSEKHRTGELPHFVAQRTGVDELATRRGENNIKIEFYLDIHSTLHEEGHFSVSGNIFVYGSKLKAWTLLEATDRVRFDIID